MNNVFLGIIISFFLKQIFLQYLTNDFTDPQKWQHWPD